MAHFTVAQAPGIWVNGYMVPTSDWQSFESRIVAGINGDDGGCYAPSAVIIIAGLGLVINGPTIVTGAGCPAGSPGQIATSGTSRFTLADAADFQDLATGHTGQTRTIVTGLASAFAAAPYAYALPGSWLASFFYPTIPLSRNRTYMAAQALACTYLSPQPITPELMCPLRVHQGAKLSSVTVTFRVSQPHTNVPTTMPKVRIVRLDAKGNFSILNITPALDGFVSVSTPASGSAWYAGGGVQALTIACTQNNVIDLSQYTYLVDIQEEQGGTSWPLAATVLQACKAAVINPAYVLNGVGVAIDGYTPSVSDRVLVVQGLPTDGIYLASAGAWTRTVDMPAASSVVAGTTVPITRGLQYAGLVFQLATGPWTVNTQPMPFILNGSPTGNLWIAAAANHTGITSTQFQ